MQKITFKKGRITATLSIHLDIVTKIRELEQTETYKYLGINEDGIQHTQMKEKLKNEYDRRGHLLSDTVDEFTK